MLGPLLLDTEKVLYCCFTAALLLLYCCFTAALLSSASLQETENVRV
jgi:hypothetical protein